MGSAGREGAEHLVGGVFSVDVGAPLPQVGAPQSAFAASRAGQGGFAAMAVARGWPARPRALGVLTGLGAANLLLPLAHGVGPAPGGGSGYYVVCAVPPGPPLSAAPRAWSEAELLEQVLRPAAQVLADLQQRSVTHRAIRAENVFQPCPGAAVTLGCAWAAPPAAHQPAWMEPPGSAACLPAARGDGAVADDVYALGALMLQLALGRNPVEGIEDGAVLRAKLDLGSFEALAGRHRLPPTLMDLLRGMLADDPEHRPSPALLQNPTAARARRVTARAARRAQGTIQIGRHPAWNAATLAHDLAAEPARGAAMLRDGSVTHWVRRSLGDTQVAAQLDALAQARDGEADWAEPLLVLRAVAMLNPAAPIAWRGVAVWPDGIGTALSQALREAPERAAVLGEMISARALAAWRERRGGPEGAPTKLDAPETRSWLLGNRAGLGIARLAYALNPLAPCEAAATEAEWVVRLADLLPALERQAGGKAEVALLAPGITAFIMARRDERLDGDLTRLAGLYTESDTMAQVRLLARLQAKDPALLLPRLTERAVARLQPMVARFGSRSRREKMAADLARLGGAGQLGPVVALLDDAAEQRADETGQAAAQDRRAAIERELASLQAPSRPMSGARDVVDALGVAGCVLAAALAVFG